MISFEMQLILALLVLLVSVCVMWFSLHRLSKHGQAAADALSKLVSRRSALASAFTLPVLGWMRTAKGESETQAGLLERIKAYLQGLRLTYEEHDDLAKTLKQCTSHLPPKPDTDRIRWNYSRNVDVCDDEVCIGWPFLSIQINAVTIQHPVVGKVTRSMTVLERSSPFDSPTTSFQPMLPSDGAAEAERSHRLATFKRNCLSRIDNLLQYELTDQEREGIEWLREAVVAENFFKDAGTKHKLRTLPTKPVNGGPSLQTAIWSDPPAA